ncbi:hypothetical protein BDW22DRAFT_1419847 [Trametopsis cervina]|nr:hypothetical protein BDW22DRAFT_1419847 [Trametopsis cervina]
MMEGIDTQWCLGCDSHYSTTDTEPYCSAECLMVHTAMDAAMFRGTVAPPSPQPIPVHHHHHQQHQHARRLQRTPSSSSFHSASFSELDLAAGYRPSPAYPYASSSSHTHSHLSHPSSSGSSKAHPWIGRGSDGVAAWASMIPYGVSPDESSSLSSSSAHSSRRSSGSAPFPSSDTLAPPPCEDSSCSITPPSRPRTRASMSSTLSLRPARLDLAQRKPAPPRLDRSAVSRAESKESVNATLGVNSPPTPTIHSKSMATITPHTSLPSLARSSASASLTSIATPGSLLQASSRPVTPPESEHGGDAQVFEEYYPREAAIEQHQHQHHSQQQQKKSNAAGKVFHNLANQLRSWAASNVLDQTAPYKPTVPAVCTHVQLQRSKTVTPPPVPLSHAVQRGDRLRESAAESSSHPHQQQERQPRPAQETVRPTPRMQPRSPTGYLQDSELADGIRELHERGVPSGSVRMGRGLVNVRKFSGGAGADERKEREEKERREREALKNRGRKSTRRFQPVDIEPAPVMSPKTPSPTKLPHILRRRLLPIPSSFPSPIRPFAYSPYPNSRRTQHCLSPCFSIASHTLAPLALAYLSPRLIPIHYASPKSYLFSLRMHARSYRTSGVVVDATGVRGSITSHGYGALHAPPLVPVRRHLGVRFSVIERNGAVRMAKARNLKWQMRWEAKAGMDSCVYGDLEFRNIMRWPYEWSLVADDNDFNRQLSSSRGRDASVHLVLFV